MPVHWEEGPGPGRPDTQAGGWEGNQEGHARGREKRGHLGRVVSRGEHWWPVSLINDQRIGQGALPGGQAECAHCGGGRRGEGK